MAIAGPWATILGAIWTNKIVVQRLTDYIWLGSSTALNEPQIRRNARIFHALGQNLKRLESYYASLKIPPCSPTDSSHPRYHPSINEYSVSHDRTVQFKIIKALKQDSVCATFLAETLGEGSKRRVVVKFVRQYNEEAHRLLADKRMAPSLIYFGKIGTHDSDPSYGDLRMAVMDFVGGTTLHDYLGSTAPKFALNSIVTGIKSVLQVLHEHGFVFADLRSSNVMITEDGRINFIDFDWVGIDEKSVYPVMMSKLITWPPGVKGGVSVMKKEHDDYMLRQIFSCV